MKTLIAILTACIAVAGLCALLLLMLWHRDHQSLSASNDSLRQELEQSRAALGAAAAENQQVTAQLDELQSTTADFKERLARLETAADAATEPLPKPYRVRAFVGKESLGDAWIIPHNVTRDPESGRYRFEPVLWLGEENKKQFTVQHTNVVEREVAATEVNNYYPNPYYYYPYYGRPWYPGGTNRPPSKPPGDGQPPYDPPTVVQTRTGGQPSMRAQMFAPPFSIVNSRPQVLGTPATSEANARIFAP